MLFNSPQFLFGFLPTFLIVFFMLASVSPTVAKAWGFLASLIFYAWDDPARLTLLILASIAFNFSVGYALARRPARWLLALGVAGDLALLGYFKYATFLISTVGAIVGRPHVGGVTTLPIGISFYTFTQIAFLVDTYRRRAFEYSPLNYGLFVTFFPHLVAGPILHHKEIIPQFDRTDVYLPQVESLLLGLSWFSIGLFKKVILADGVAAFVEPAFKAAMAGAPVSFGAAWSSAISYALQIYFDFSGYSDMAIGLACMIGITFPLNFDSPYKSVSLIEFWRRWHMTLSRFLRDYLYISLGGNRHGPYRRYANLLITMVLGGLWHGAGWNFALWGAIHGAGLAINHLWRAITQRIGLSLPKPICRAVTLLTVVLAWVPFRAEDLPSTFVLWHSMFDFSNASLSIEPSTAAFWIATLSAVVLFAPNTQQLLDYSSQAGTAPRLNWAPSIRWALVLGLLFGIAVSGTFSHQTYFLYYRF